MKIKKWELKKINRSASPEKEKIVEEEEESAWDSKFQYLLALLGWAVGLGKFLKINFFVKEGKIFVRKYLAFSLSLLRARRRGFFDPLFDNVNFRGVPTIFHGADVRAAPPRGLRQTLAKIRHSGHGHRLCLCYCKSKIIKNLSN